MDALLWRHIFFRSSCACFYAIANSSAPLLFVSTPHFPCQLFRDKDIKYFSLVTNPKAQSRRFSHERTGFLQRKGTLSKKQRAFL